MLHVASTPVEPEDHKSDGGADPEGDHPVLRVRAGEAQGPLPEHALLKGLPIFYFLRFLADQINSDTFPHIVVLLECVNSIKCFFILCECSCK